MRTHAFKKTLLLVATFAMTFQACKKDDKTIESNDLKLVKIASWNPSTNKESVHTEFTYGSDGMVKTVAYNGNLLAATYASDKIVALSGKNTTNGEYSFKIEYNALGKVTKVTHVNMAPKDFGYVSTFTYNSAGKMTQRSTLYSDPANGTVPAIETFNWNGDNVTSVGRGGAYVTEYIAYDDKINPYAVDGGVGVLLNGNPASKNNVTEIKSTSSTYSVVQKRVYEYNAAGYATSMKLMDGSNEGTKFYYNK